MTPTTLKPQSMTPAWRPGQALTITYTIGAPATDGATPGTDFPAQTGTITFEAGSTTAVLTFDATYDAVVENTESFTVTVGAGTGYQVSTTDATVTGTIPDGTIYGTEGNDVALQGTNDGDAIFALGGNDRVEGLGGDDFINGGDGSDSLFGGAGNDAIDGGDGRDSLAGGAGNDTIDGGNNLDVAFFAGARSEYTITPGGVAGSSTVTDTVGGAGTDTLTNVELTEFSNAYVLNQRMLDLSTFELVAGKQIFGTNNNIAGAGDNLTLGTNANGRFIDLAGGGTDTLTLAAGGAYTLNLSGVEVLAGSGGNDSVSLQKAVSGMAINLAVGADSLNLANGGNSVTVRGTESIHGGGGFDAVTLGDATAVTINSIESVIGGGGDNQVTINADPGVTSVTTRLDLDGDDTVKLNFSGPSTVANLFLTGVEHLTSAGGVQTVNLTSDVGLTSVDLGGGFHTLNLAPGDHNLSVANVFTSIRSVLTTIRLTSMRAQPRTKQSIWDSAMTSST